MRLLSLLAATDSLSLWWLLQINAACAGGAVSSQIKVLKPQLKAFSLVVDNFSDLLDHQLGEGHDLDPLLLTGAGTGALLAGRTVSEGDLLAEMEAFEQHGEGSEACMPCELDSLPWNGYEVLFFGVLECAVLCSPAALRLVSGDDSAEPSSTPVALGSSMSAGMQALVQYGASRLVSPPTDATAGRWLRAGVGGAESKLHKAEWADVLASVKKLRARRKAEGAAAGVEATGGCRRACPPRSGTAARRGASSTRTATRRSTATARPSWCASCAT